MTEVEDNEAFRKEFVSRMAQILGIQQAPEIRSVAVVAQTTPKVTTITPLLAAVVSAKREIDQLRGVIERYELLAHEMKMKRSPVAANSNSEKKSA